ncbi:MAG: threonine--tRNA ligase [Acidobacteriota bacterium]
MSSSRSSSTVDPAAADGVWVRLPDGSRHALPQGSTARDVAALLGEATLHAAVAARVNGHIVDLLAPLPSECTVEPIVPPSAEALEVTRHTAAHVLAQAVKELYPEAQIGIGPVVDEGFYYDFRRETPFTPEDLSQIEHRMQAIVERDLPLRRIEQSREEAAELFEKRKEQLKVELIRDKGGEVVSCYQQGSFVDFCRGPHLPSTGRVGAFKLTSIAGAYWRGDESEPMLQRIYGTAFFTREELKRHLELVEEARKRDHRRLGKELDLFSIQEAAGGGLIFWHPKGATIRRIIDEFWTQEHLRRGYQLVCIPHLSRSDLWDKSGHLSYYRENMYTFRTHEDEEFVLKPMNCPGHVLIYKSRKRSYRDLPIRYAEMGTVYRAERSGVLHGMFRVRGFTQDDAHIFCTREQAVQEVASAIELARFMLETFGYEHYEVDLSLRDPKQTAKYAGAPADWDMAEGALAKALEKVNLPYNRVVGEAAFYGPKVDIRVFDALGRSWQGPTIQFDFNLPARLNVRYVNRESKEEPVVMVHRTVLGSMERFVGSLIEHYAGAFPLWLAPVQVKVLPITERAHARAQEVAAGLFGAGLRVEVDERNEKIGFKIRQAQLEQTPYMLILGDREIVSGEISVRSRRGGDLGTFTLSKFVDQCHEKIRSRDLEN